MKKLQSWFTELIRNPGKAFLVAALTKILMFGIDQLFVVLHLPKIASESDHLTYNQVLTGYILSITSFLSTILSLVFGAIFTVSLFYWIYRMVKSPKS